MRVLVVIHSRENTKLIRKGNVIIELLCGSAVNNNYIIMQMLNIDLSTNYATGRREAGSRVCVCVCVCVCVWRVRGAKHRVESSSSQWRIHREETEITKEMQEKRKYQGQSQATAEGTGGAACRGFVPGKRPRGWRGESRGN
jgi:hypothetical protein